MQSKYIVKTYKTDDYKTISVLNTESRKLIKFYAVPVENQNEFIKTLDLKVKVKAMGEVDGTETASELQQYVPFVYLKDHSVMGDPYVRSQLCVSFDNWEHSIIHQDARSSFNCILERLLNPTGIIITIETDEG